jgi:hypothetical protein
MKLETAFVCGCLTCQVFTVYRHDEHLPDAPHRHPEPARTVELARAALAASSVVSWPTGFTGAPGG